MSEVQQSYCVAEVAEGRSMPQTTHQKAGFPGFTELAAKEARLRALPLDALTVEAVRLDSALKRAWPEREGLAQFI